MGFGSLASRLDSPAPRGIYSPMFRMRPRLSGFIEPCLPSPAPNPPAGDGWIHEIKLNFGARVLALVCSRCGYVCIEGRPMACRAAQNHAPKEKAPLDGGAKN
jgi:hypothetical protein